MVIDAILLPPEMFTRSRQDANDSLFVLRPWCNAIIVHTPPASGSCLQVTHSAQAQWCFIDGRRSDRSFDIRSRNVMWRWCQWLSSLSLCLTFYIMERNKRPWSNQAQLGLRNFYVKVNTRSWYWNRPRPVQRHPGWRRVNSFSWRKIIP